jgi:hypothetical protein
MRNKIPFIINEIPINKIPFIIIIIVLWQMTPFCSCNSAGKITARYYYDNQQILDSIENSYSHLYLKHPFSLEFTDKNFSYISIEIITDTLRYIYEFHVNEPRLTDTLRTYGLDEQGIYNLMKQMKEVHCTWINNLDYYTDENKKSLTFISIRPLALNSPFNYKKYYILTYFSQPQYFDSEGRLLDNRTLRKLRRINDDIFRRINDRVCYTISERFR